MSLRFETFLIFGDFEVKYLPLPERYDSNVNVPFSSIISSQKTSKKFLGTAVFSLQMPFENCTENKLILTSSVIRFWLLVDAKVNKPIFASSLHKKIEILNKLNKTLPSLSFNYLLL